MDYTFGVVEIASAAVLEHPGYIGGTYDQQTIDNLPEYVLFFFAKHKRFGVAKVEVTNKNVNKKELCASPNIKCESVYCFEDEELCNFLKSKGMKEQSIVVLEAAAILAAMKDAGNAAAILAEMDANNAAAILAEMDANNAAAILAEMKAEQAAEILEAMPFRAKFGVFIAKPDLHNENESKRHFDQFGWLRAISEWLAHKALNFKGQIVCQGPPGTGKSYNAKKMARALTGQTEDSQSADKANDQWQMVQFHPSYNYEDFVRGIQVNPDQNGQVQYKTVNRIFAEMCETAKKNPTQAYVLIIDEMNRANLPSVLGELIYGLEYRGEEVQTPYAVNNKTGLVVPENLFVIGTMNTADRSIGHIDYAIRRRFAFIDVLPSSGTVTNHYKDDDLKGKAKGYFEKVEGLFEHCLNSEYKKEHVQIGHSYFMASSEDDLNLKMQYEVLPILREYVQDGILDDSKSPDGSERKLEDILASWKAFQKFLTKDEKAENQNSE